MTYITRDFEADFGAWIRRTREHAGLSREALARRIGVTRQALTKWEEGETAPTLINAVLLSAALNASLPLPNPRATRGGMTDDEFWGSYMGLEDGAA